MALFDEERAITINELPLRSRTYRGAQAIRRAFDRFSGRFRQISRRACENFEKRSWVAAHDDAIARLDLYGDELDRLITQLDDLLGDELRDRGLWSEMRAIFHSLIAGRHDQELGGTFFNSTTRRIFTTVGVDPRIEFVDFDSGLPQGAARAPLFRRYFRVESSAVLIDEILADQPFRSAWQDRDRDIRRAGELLDEQLAEHGHPSGPLTAEMLVSVFYRNKGAYVIGRIRAGDRTWPFVLPLVHTPAGIAVDAVLTRTSEVSVVFSFTRSYFHVEVEQHRELIAFLKSIMPEKPVAELYTAIGYNKHGKTIFYGDLLRHLEHSEDRFEFTPGDVGLVMIVFTLPSYDVVFKVIRDRFSHPKSTSRQRVMASYRLVQRHDRAGRLVDAQEFEHLEFERDRFAPDLLDELLRSAGRTVSLDGDRVVISHLYTERRVTPLNLFIREQEEDAARAVVADYGQAIKDLAAANVFPGDLLIKNFGVTRNRRAVFYDYDEISLLTDCNFREIPAARTVEEEMATEPWFAVRENDIFPEEFPRFLGLPRPLREHFAAHHGDLFAVDFWRGMQEQVRRGEMADIFPYRPASRLAR
jgi:isocitrate dehydrogenase kinase/phosphatase